MMKTFASVLFLASLLFSRTSAEDAVRAGAFDYIGFPPRQAEIEWAIENALNERARQNQLKSGEVRQPSNRIGGMPWTPEE